jgi:hypothetical protein
MKCTVLGTLILALAAGGTVAAHHSYGGFEPKLTTFRGVVEELRWQNPHSLLVFKTDEGQVLTAEWGGVAALTRWGLDARTLVPGDRVIVTGRVRMDSDGRLLVLREIERPADGWRWPARAAIQSSGP